MNAIEWTVELRLALALVLGFLVGLERESTKADADHQSHQRLIFGGVRTFPILSMFGYGCAYLSKSGMTFLLPVGLLAISAMVAVSYVAKIRVGRYGSTSEMSALLTFIVGALTLMIDVWIPMALAIVNTILLSEKAELEHYVESLNKVEFLAVLKFVLVTIIILPVLPDADFTRFKLNPTRIWQIVILVASIGFVGYYLSKKFGERVGLWLSGILGGIVSSTAVTIAVGRIAAKDTSRSSAALQASILASSVMYLRILVLIWIINSGIAALLWWRLVLLALVGIAFAVRFSSPTKEKIHEPMPSLQNPFEIRPSMVFAGLFVVLTILTEFTRQTVGDAGVLGLSAFVGVTDIDPFILSLVRGASLNGGRLIVSAILIAMMSNTIAKAVYFGWLVPQERKETRWRYGLWVLLHIPLVVL